MSDPDKQLRSDLAYNEVMQELLRLKQQQSGSVGAPSYQITRLESQRRSLRLAAFRIQRQLGD
ncbi:hypothetical protein KC906_03125 [Candidatus Kaiserbacteria bacterium]|nr:hypothetical protein [Candidatus Kaiserbacteria bacterium]MCB9812310.1 hypothetical protein [Candidatus Nomurabacteria bacterium]